MLQNWLHIREENEQDLYSGQHFTSWHHLEIDISDNTASTLPLLSYKNYKSLEFKKKKKFICTIVLLYCLSQKTIYNLFEYIGILTKSEIAAKPSKIVAGLEPTKTNQLLQSISKCLDKKVVE